MRTIAIASSVAPTVVLTLALASAQAQPVLVQPGSASIVSTFITKDTALVPLVTTASDSTQGRVADRINASGGNGSFWFDPAGRPQSLFNAANAQVDYLTLGDFGSGLVPGNRSRVTFDQSSEANGVGFGSTWAALNQTITLAFTATDTTTIVIRGAFDFAFAGGGTEQIEATFALFALDPTGALFAARPAPTLALNPATGNVPFTFAVDLGPGDFRLDLTVTTFAAQGPAGNAARASATGSFDVDFFPSPVPTPGAAACCILGLCLVARRRR